MRLVFESGASIDAHSNLLTDTRIQWNGSGPMSNRNTT